MMFTESVVVVSMWLVEAFGVIWKVSFREATPVGFVGGSGSLRFGASHVGG